MSVQAGYAYSNILTSGSEGSSYSEQELDGIRVGLIYDDQLSDIISVQSGVLYTVLGDSKVQSGVKTDITLQYLDIPVRMSIRYHVNQATSLFAYAGPVFNLGLSGLTRSESTIFGVTTIVKDPWYQEEDYMSRLDIQLGGGLGIRYHDLYLKAGYDQGMLNLNIDEESRADKAIRRNQFTISAGVYF